MEAGLEPLHPAVAWRDLSHSSLQSLPSEGSNHCLDHLLFCSFYPSQTLRLLMRAPFRLEPTLDSSLSLIVLCLLSLVFLGQD